MACCSSLELRVCPVSGALLGSGFSFERSHHEKVEFVLEFNPG